MQTVGGSETLKEVTFFYSEELLTTDHILQLNRVFNYSGSWKSPDPLDTPETRAKAGAQYLKKVMPVSSCDICRCAFTH